MQVHAIAAHAEPNPPGPRLRSVTSSAAGAEVSPQGLTLYFLGTLRTDADAATPIWWSGNANAGSTQATRALSGMGRNQLNCVN